jgi:hypothetical protein
VPEWVPGGEPGCTLRAGIGQGRLDWQGAGDYAWDVVEGVGLPGAMAVDAIVGTNGTQQILDDAGIGTYLGMTFTTIATAGPVARMAQMEAHFVQGMAWGSAIDITVQTVTNQGNVNWTQAYFSTLAGGLGGTLGGGVGATRSSLMSKMFLNGVGSGGIGGLLAFLQNEATGSCYTSEDILFAAWINAGLDASGSAVGDGFAARAAVYRGRFIQANLHSRVGWKYTKNRVGRHQTPAGQLDWSSLSHNHRSLVMNYMVSQNLFVPQDPRAFWIAAMNSAGMVVSNSGVLIPPPPDEARSSEN